MAWLHLAVVLTAMAGYAPPSRRSSCRPNDGRPPGPNSRLVALDSTGQEGCGQEQGCGSDKVVPGPVHQRRLQEQRLQIDRRCTRKKRNKAPTTRGQGKRKDATQPPAAKTGRDDDVRIRTQAEMRKPRSPFLLPPGGMPGDRYGSDELDWSEVPAWRQTSFFGIRRGQFFVYVVDCSGSMIDDDRIARATIELRHSVFALQQPQKFEVIFYNTESIPMPGGPIPRSADFNRKTSYCCGSA